jgi:hypothetical protein
MFKHRAVILSVCALFAFSTYAENDLLDAGVIEFGTGWAFACKDDLGGEELDDLDYPMLFGAGRMSLPLSERMSAQLDIGGFNTFTSRSDGDDQLQTYFHGGAHLAVREPEEYAVGVFGLAGSANGGEDENALIGLAGLEGQYYLDALTLYGQVGMLHSDDEDEGDSISDAWLTRGVVRYFLDDDTMAQVETTYGQGKGGDAGDLVALSWAAQYARRVEDRPYAWFLGYNGNHVNADSSIGDDKVTEHTFMVGLKMVFGAATLLENDRRGATFDMPDVGRWAGWTLEVID